MSTRNIIIGAAVVLLLVVLALKMTKSDNQPGDAMRNAADSVSDGIKEAGDKIKDATN